VLGGFNSKGATTPFDVWNPVLNNWGMAVPLPQALHHTTVAVVSEKIYVIGGFKSGLWKPVNTTYEYDTDLHRWSNTTPMLTARGAHQKSFNLVNSDAHEVCDPATDYWEILPPLPTPRDHLTATEANGKLFVIDGRIDVNYHNNLNSNESYNPKIKKSTKHAPLATARSGITSQFLTGWIHVFGGESGQGTFIENEGYNPATNKRL
jgi:N-acetylneuraminic acid mutarotase